MGLRMDAGRAKTRHGRLGLRQPKASLANVHCCRPSVLEEMLLAADIELHGVDVNHRRPLRRARDGSSAAG